MTSTNKAQKQYKAGDRARAVGLTQNRGLHSRLGVRVDRAYALYCN